MLLGESVAPLVAGDRCMLCVRPETPPYTGAEPAQGKRQTSSPGQWGFAIFHRQCHPLLTSMIGTDLTFRVDIQNPRIIMLHAIGDRVVIRFSARSPWLFPFESFRQALAWKSRGEGVMAHGGAVHATAPEDRGLSAYAAIWAFIAVFLIYPLIRLSMMPSPRMKKPSP